MPLAISLVVNITEPPVSTTATGKSMVPSTELRRSVIVFGAPSTHAVIESTDTRQKVSPALDAMRSMNLAADGLKPGTRLDGCCPILSREGIRELPGRSRDKPRNRWAGAVSTGVRPKRFCCNVAPSGASLTVAGIFCDISELKGRARPRRPTKLGERVSSVTWSAAASAWEGIVYGPSLKVSQTIGPDAAPRLTSVNKGGAVAQ
jgi:hypothetical protein